MFASIRHLEMICETSGTPIFDGIVELVPVDPRMRATGSFELLASLVSLLVGARYAACVYIFVSTAFNMFSVHTSNDR